MKKDVLVREILKGMEYKEDIRNGIWINNNPDYQELFFHAHDGMLPDDHRYKMIHDLLSSMSEYESMDDIRDNDYEILDNNIPVYTNQLLNWLSSSNSRYTYIDDAISTYGKDESSIINDISNGYREELTEVFYLIVEWLDENTDEEE